MAPIDQQSLDRQTAQNGEDVGRQTSDGTEVRVFDDFAFGQ
jgi:hypothetical protein